MRIALITLALTALVFIGSIVYSLAGKWGFSLPNKTTSTQDTPIAIETLKYQIKNEERINELMKKVEALSNSQDTTSSIVPDANTPTLSGASSTASGKVIPLSGKFLARAMPALEFSLVPNAGIYDLVIMEKATDYSTYLDAKQGIKAMALAMKYDLFLKNMRSLSKEVYAVNETKTFPFRSFYLNPPKSDTLVRLVIEIESQTIALEIPKTKFPTFKALLLKK